MSVERQNQRKFYAVVSLALTFFLSEPLTPDRKYESTNEYMYQLK